jgi:GT2 family glycosyltransferase
MARNRVLSMAQDRDCDFLTFVDDDERVDSDWLVRIIAGITERDLDLVGGPLTIEAADAPLTRWQEGFLSHLQERARKRNTKRASAVSSGQDGQLNIYTNNWCARMETVQRLGLWFDEDRQFTGGSDTKFSRDMARAGARIGWICDASVHDRIPRNRLCAAYHYRRARDQATNYVLLNDCNRWKLMYKSVPRAVGGVFLVALGLPFNLRYAVKGIFRLGAVVGRVRGILGGVSRLYVPSVEYRPH